MSKGSSYWGTARGKIGNTVVSVVRGQRIERAYQPNVLNPRSVKQMTQRAKFFNAVGFYKQSNQAFFKMAYEDKRANESDYNAFMRHNTRIALLSSRLVVNQCQGTAFAAPYPSRWMISQGSLAPIDSEVGSGGILFSVEGASAQTTTVGALSTLLIATGNYLAGDIVTFVQYLTSVTAASSDDGANKDATFLYGDPLIAPKFVIKQFVLSTTDNTTLAEYGITFSADNSAMLAQFDSDEGQFSMGAIVVSRLGTTLKVSDAFLTPDADSEAVLDDMDTDAWNESVLQQWKTAEAAILEGALV